MSLRFKSGVPVFSFENCQEDSPSSMDVICMENIVKEGLLSELSTSSQVSELPNSDGDLYRADDDLLEEQEQELKCCCSYLSTVQAATGLTPAQRATLVDSMISLTEQIGLNNDTLFKAVACLDRYLSVGPVSLALLQPVSIACLWIASKYEELASIPAVVFAPFMVSPDGQSLGSEAQAVHLLVKLEIGVLRALDYRLASIITPKAFKHKFLQRLWTDAGAVGKRSERQHQQLYSMTSYLTEVSLLEYQLLRWPPSMLAAASYALAQLLLGLHLDNKSLLDITGYSYEELRVVMQFLCSLHATLFQALAGGVPYNVSKKYCGGQLSCVAAIPPLAAGDPRLSA